MSVTELVTQPPAEPSPGRLKSNALSNIELISSTAAVFQPEMSSLNLSANLNVPAISATCLVFQAPIPAPGKSDAISNMLEIFPTLTMFQAPTFCVKKLAL